MRTIPKNKVYNEEEIELQDGTQLTLRPSVIAVLRKGNKKMQEFPEQESEDEALTVLVEAAFICIENQLEEEKRSLEWAENSLDTESMYKVLEVCLGIKLNNPKLLEALENSQNPTE